MASLAGKYKFETAENIDDYLKGLGVGLVLRKVLSVSKPVMDINYSPDVDEWSIRIESPFKNRTMRFKLGNPFDDETYDARKCRTVAKMDGEEKIVFVQECDEGPAVTMIKEKVTNEADLMKITMTSGDLVTTHFYRKLTE